MMQPPDMLTSLTCSRIAREGLRYWLRTRAASPDGLMITPAKGIVYVCGAAHAGWQVTTCHHDGSYLQALVRHEKAGPIFDLLAEANPNDFVVGHSLPAMSGLIGDKISVRIPQTLRVVA